MKREKSSSPKKDFISGMLLIFLLYFLALLLTPLFAPWEYEIIFLIRQSCPYLPAGHWFLRLLPLVSVFVVSWLIWLTSRNFGQKRPGWSAACFLLLPPVFWAGSRIQVAPLLMLGTFSLFSGLLFLIHPQKRYRRILGLLLLILGGMMTWLLAKSSLPLGKCWCFFFFPFLALLVTACFEALESRGIDMGKFLNRFARFFSYSLALLALLILLPALLRLCHVPFPENLSLYQSERLYRPIVVLLVPLLWFHLLRLTPVLERKLTFLAVGIGFLMMTFPLALPWQNLIDLAPEFMMQKLPEIRQGNAVCFADAKTRPVLAELLHCEVRPIGTAPGEIPPEQLASEIKKVLSHGDVILGYEGHRLDAFQPAFSGIHYRAGKRVYCRYFGGKTK